MITHNNELDLVKQPIPLLIRKLAIPASMGFFFYTMYNVVDTYFAGLVSTQALAALSLSFPVFFIVVALGNGLSTGTTALVANALGEGNNEEAATFAMQGITFGVITSALLTAVGLLISPFLFSLLGASGTYLQDCLAYMDIMFWGAVVFILPYMLNGILNAVGDTVSFRNFLIAGFVLNCILDPWFVLGGFGLPAMGLRGVAVATIVIQGLGALYLWIRVQQSGLLSCVSGRQCFVPNPRYMLAIAGQGFPASFTMLTVGIGIFIINYFISDFGKEAIAAYGVAMRVEQVVLIPSIGFNVATLSIIAQNNGAKQLERIWETIKKILTYGAYLMGLGGVLVFILAPYLMQIFNKDPVIIDVGTTYLRIDAFVFYGYAVLFMNVSALQGVKRPMFGVYIGLFRQIIAPFIVFPIMVTVLSLGLTGIWWGILIIVWVSALFSMWFTVRTIRRLDFAQKAHPNS